MITAPRVRLALLAAAAGTLVIAATPAPAARGIGDTLFPDLGNPGYDVRAYDISVSYGGDNTKPVNTVTKIDAVATQRLKAINLDFTHGTVGSAYVNGEPAGYATAGEDLVLTPAKPVRAGGRLQITIKHVNETAGNDKAGGWEPTPNGLALLNEPDGAHRAFPSNDHPSDKAFFTYRITLPKRLTAVTNGLPVSRTEHGATTTWVYRTAHPMATDLMQVSMGDSVVIHRVGPHGLPVRDVVPAADRDVLEPWLEKTPEQISWMERQLGVRYPLEAYGLLVTDTNKGAELETQTLSIFEKSLFTRSDLPGWVVPSVMVHELSHQWFGDSVSPESWSDVWLSEGHATWYETLYGEHEGGTSMDQRMEGAYRQADIWRSEGGAPAVPKPVTPGDQLSLFRPGIYDGGALVLYALRQEVGDSVFQRIEHDWVLRHRDGSAGTEDFIALASAVSGRDLSGFLKPWLYGEKTPPMPGHPDWRTDTPAAN